MVAGADSINDMDLLRHGALPDLFGGIRAPSTLGSHLRSFTWGNVRQLEVVNRRLLGELARRTPLLPGRDTMPHSIDIAALQARKMVHRSGLSRYEADGLEGLANRCRQHRPPGPLNGVC